MILADLLTYKKPYEIKETLKNMEIKTVRTNKKIDYLNIPIAFDIETTSFIDANDDKTAIMYIWMVNFNGVDFIGRTWEEFTTFCDDISDYLSLHEKRRAIFYVHNLAYEFQFICKRFSWLKVFALDTRKPCYALSNIGIEFRCSYLLSGYSLEKLADTLINHNVKKLVGNLDYSLTRHSKTMLSDDELMYCLNDVRVVSAYIDERIETDGNISLIPLTKTGYVRKHCKYNCIGKGNKRAVLYRDVMRTLTIEDDEYLQLKRAFQGGFTHANPFYSGKTLYDVSSFDFTSSYPAVMVAEKFPMSKGELIELENSDDFYNNINLYCCMFDATFTDIEPIVYFDNYISMSRTWGTLGAVINNGRIVKADTLSITLTDVDFRIISRMYKWGALQIGNFRRYKRAYLPTSFVRAILGMYGDKTRLKGVDGSEYEYSRSKEMLNSAYGMTVTDICRDEITYTDKWENVQPDLHEMLIKYNNSKGRFLFYPWGVWVTAYARKNLFTGILECANDYVYADTDSIKILNKDNHLEYIEEYNERITEQLKAAMMFHNLPADEIAPKTIKGIIKPLGVWDYEGTYTRFKTLGAKRYLVEKDGIKTLTVSGLRKDTAIKYLESIYDDVFDAFNDELYIPKGHTGKMIHTYIDDERKGMITDYKGNVSSYDELSAVHLDNADYSLKIGHEYARFLLGVQTLEW